MEQFPSIAVEGVTDSSRYFVIRIEDGNGTGTEVWIPPWPLGTVFPVWRGWAPLPSGRVGESLGVLAVEEAAGFERLICGL